MVEALKGGVEFQTNMFVPENQIFHYMKAAKETGANLKIIKRPGELFDAVNEYIELKDYFIQISHKPELTLTSFLERVNEFLNPLQSK